MPDKQGSTVYVILISLVFVLSVSNTLSWTSVFIASISSEYNNNIDVQVENIYSGIKVLQFNFDWILFKIFSDDLVLTFDDLLSFRKELFVSNENLNI